LKDDNSLVRFLFDYPWTSKPVLESVFGNGFKRLAKTRETREIEVPGVGTCWGIKQEKLSSVPGVRRREQAKFHLLAQYGKDSLWTGGSPGLWGSDLTALVGRNEKKYWVRIWVDNGGPTVEALSFLHRSIHWDRFPAKDIVITTSLDRAELIKRQVSAKWKRGKENLLIYAKNEDQYLKLNEYGRPSPGIKTSAPDLANEFQAELVSSRWQRLENKRHDQIIGKHFLSLWKVDFEILAYVGNNPNFNLDEIAYLLTYGSTGTLGVDNKEKENQHVVVSRLEKLLSLGLIEQARAPLVGIKVSPSGLEVLAKYWGITQERMRRFHAWPQKRSGGGVIEYSENALSHIKDHTQDVQRFIFGLFDNARRLQKPYGGVDISLDTIVGKRIYFEDLATRELRWLIPDAAIVLSFWRRTWRDGQVHEPKIVFSSSRMLVEFDRATNPIDRLYERIKKYGRIWHQLSGNPVLVWVIDGTPWREKEILEMLGEAGIPGWSVLVERLKLGQGDPWWEWHMGLDGELPYSKHQGFAPLRDVWRNTKDYELHPLLGHSPWAKTMSQSKPMIKVPRGY
jgi:hypothetical protein